MSDLRVAIAGIAVIADIHGFKYRRDPWPHISYNGGEMRPVPDSVVMSFLEDNDLKGLHDCLLDLMGKKYD